MVASQKSKAIGTMTGMAPATASEYTVALAVTSALSLLDGSFVPDATKGEDSSLLLVSNAMVEFETLARLDVKNMAGEDECILADLHCSSVVAQPAPSVKAVYAGATPHEATNESSCLVLVIRTMSQ